MLLFYLSLIESDKSKIEFEYIYYAYKDPMYAYACKLLDVHEHLAEDVVQSAFFSIAVNMETVGYLSDVAIKSYVFKTVKNAALKLLKKEKVLISLEETEFLVADLRTDQVLEEICSEENYALIVNTIRSLPEPYKDVLSLYYLCDLELKEIAKQFDYKYDTVKKQFQRGKRLLAHRLKEGGALYAGEHRVAQK